MQDPKLALLPQEEIFRYKNIYVAQELIPKVFRLILSWGCPCTKPPDMPYSEFCEKLKNPQNLREYFIKPDIEKLKLVTDENSIDVILLFKLIQTCCEKLKHKRDPVWYQPDDSKLEYMLWRGKEIRNDICHNVASKGTKSATFQDSIDICQKIVVLGSQIYDIDEETVNQKLGEILDIPKQINDKEDQRNKAYIQYNFWKEGFKESESYWKVHCSSEVLLFTGEKVMRDKIYHPLNISIKTLTSSENLRMNQEIMSYTQIVEPWSNEENFSVTIVKGEAGSGKSTVAKNLAQQFYKLTKTEIDSLDRFHLIHFLECRSRTSKNLENFITNSFPKTTRILGVKDILNCFDSLGHLIFIDGFDERNENSLNVMNEILSKVKMLSNCQVVITTRPHAMSELKEMIDDFGLIYRTCEIMPISDESQQIEFLRRYHDTLDMGKNNDSEDLISAFKSLSFDVKSFFVFPINLLLFFHLYHNAPNKNNILKNVSDIPQKILYHYKTFIKKKIGNEGLKNIELMIEEILDEFYEFAFECLKDDKLTLLEDDILNISKKCINILEEYGHSNEINVDNIFSVIFLSKCSPTPEARPCYQFFHKSIQEIFASRALLNSIRANCNESIDDIFKSKFTTIDSFEKLILIEKKFINVYKFLILELHRNDDKKALQFHLPDISHIMKKSKVDFKFCAELVSACQCHDYIAKHIASATGIFWGDRSGLLLPAMWKMLEFKQPQQLRAFFPKGNVPVENFKKFLEVVRMKYTGVFVLEMASFFSYTPSDEIWNIMKGAKCQLARFRACLATDESIEILSKLTKRSVPDLHISLKEPLCHTLHKLQLRKHYLSVTIKYSDEWPECPLDPSTYRPLPTGSQPPWLIVTDIPEDGIKKTQNIIVALTSTNKRYRELELKNCSLPASSLDKLVTHLKDWGIQTTNSSDINSCQWTEARQSDSGHCWSCGSKVHADGRRCVRFQIKKESEGVKKTKSSCTVV